MEKKTLAIIGIIAIIVIGVLAIFLTSPSDRNGRTPDDNIPDQENPSLPLETSEIRVSTPLPNALVSSPLVVRGEARGTWYFEASFPVRLLDANGREIAVAPAQAQGEWMTEDFVPFQVTLSFSAPTTGMGTLVLERDNPSGLPENAREVRMPVRFKSTSAGSSGEMRNVTLYYYNPEKDKDASGNIMCSKQGLVAVSRQIPVTNSPIQDTINLLMRGGPTTEEKAAGVVTEFPISNVSLKGANLSNGTLTLEFDDPGHRTSGGSCRVSLLWAQIEATAKQFTGVNQVRAIPSSVFQP